MNNSYFINSEMRPFFDESIKKIDENDRILTYYHFAPPLSQRDHIYIAMALEENKELQFLKDHDINVVMFSTNFLK